MGFWGWLLRRRASADHGRAVHAVGAVDEAMASGDHDLALELCHAALVDGLTDPGLLRVTARVLLIRGEGRVAELFARAADVPGDPDRMAELGSALVTAGAPRAAAVVLDRALAAAPFDAVIRSELAIAQSRAGQPGRAVQTLALHPCLADDAGAIFQFAWASLLTGDLRSAATAGEQLRKHRSAPTLVRKLESALARAAIPFSASPPDARDFLFLEHGSVLLDLAPLHGGSHVEIAPDGPLVASLVSRAAQVLRGLAPKLEHVAWLDEAARPAAEELALTLGSEAEAWRTDGTFRGVLVATRAMDLVSLDRRPASGLVTLALSLEWGAGTPPVPDLVGLLARRVTWPSGPVGLGSSAAQEDPELAAFVHGRLAVLPPNVLRVASAFVPDAPLPWPWGGTLRSPDP